MDYRQLEVLAGRLSRVAEKDPDPWRRHRAALALGDVGRAMQRVGEAAEDVARDAQTLRDTARRWQWPASILEYAEDAHDPEMMRRALRAAREQAWTDVDRHLRMVGDALADGDVTSARASFRRAATRWRAFMRQVERTAADARANRGNVVTRWAESVEEATRDPLPDMPSPLEARNLGLFVLAGLAALLLLR